MEHSNSRGVRTLGCVALLTLLAGAAAAAPPVELAGLQTSQAAVQARLSARADCLAWSRFGPVPAGLSFAPAPAEDPLTETAAHCAHDRARRGPRAEPAGVGNRAVSEVAWRRSPRPRR